MEFTGDNKAMHVALRRCDLNLAVTAGQADWISPSMRGVQIHLSAFARGSVGAVC